ncbi:hypothetical protein [Brevundimonas nasdae]|uniref:Uncharacterized protein n=1 Tax=Brevundimonas nasdae TaxID=172043 RepID=A0ABX8TH44_9CAUL|nr:hypothetical protein [Brevundimonas nasdae]QYC10556.1 hypothetical protein KWG56_00590 [Brevundimonas nasdae]QYC13343.1 hypothetical protein KWG63_14145 [Brevundimonas nasdae]
MIERRLFLIIRAVEDGLTVTVTPVQPLEQPQALAVIRTVGDVAAETVLHFPGAVVRED